MKMSPESGTHSAESDVVELNFNETELTLSLPGTKTGTKRGFSESSNGFGSSTSTNYSPEPPKAQMVGWPPVRASRKNMMKGCKYVKVGAVGTPYLRKVDLETYESYDQLLRALETMFCGLKIHNHLNERKLKENGNGADYMPTYEDKDGDWMLVGDVPWKMFVESCKRMRLIISSEAAGLEILESGGGEVRRV